MTHSCMRFVFALFVFLFASNGFALDKMEKGFVQASQLKVRTRADKKSKEVVSLPIGTEVEYGKKNEEWCNVKSKTPKGEGFVLCNFLSGDRPTLEKINKLLEKADKKSKEYDDLISRKFYLSPSVLTIKQYRSAKGKADIDSIRYMNEKWEQIIPPPDHSKIDPFSSVLMKSFEGKISGTDFLPVSDQLNPMGLTASLISLGGITEGEIPKASPSFFESTEDVFAVLGEPFLEKAAGQSIYKSDGHSGLLDLFEFIKRYPGLEIIGSVTPPVGNDNMGESYSLAGVGGVNFEYINGVPVYFLTNKGPVEAKLNKISIAFVSKGCVQELSNSYSSSRPVTGRIFSVLFMPKKKSFKGYKAKSGKGWWTVDLNGDGIADLAGTESSTLSVVDEERLVYKGFLHMNIKGVWYVRDSIMQSDCT